VIQPILSTHPTYVSQFPCINPSRSEDDAASSIDISRLLSQIRSRYKALPRLQSSTEVADEGKLEGSDMQVDKPSKDSAIPIWKLDKTGAKKPLTN
jgi:hypothetical protein